MNVVAPPDRLDSLDVIWLRLALAAQLKAAKTTLRRSSVERVSGSTGGTAAYGIVDLEYSNPSTKLPKRMFAKVFEQSDLVGAPPDVCRNEVIFYSTIAPKTSLAVPMAYYSGFDESRSVGMLLLQDMSDHRLGDSITGCTVQEAKALVEAIGSFHLTWANQEMPSEVRTLYRFPDMLKAGLKRFHPSQIRDSGALGDLVPANSYSDAVITLLDARYESVIEQSWNDPNTLVHGDLRLENVYFDHFSESPTPVVFDWGTIGVGHGSIDLACLLTTGVADLTTEDEFALLNHYTQVTLGVALAGSGDFMNRYRMAVVEMFLRRLIGMRLLEGVSESSQVHRMRSASFTRSAESLERHDCLELLQKIE